MRITVCTPKVRVSQGNLARHTDCTRCVLHKESNSIGIPARMFAPCKRITDTAVVFVGTGPGYNEDQEGECFVGRSGEKLDQFYLHGPELDLFADVYATNVVRCKPPSDKPSRGQIKACAPYLEDDLGLVSKSYPRTLVIAVGSYATNALTGRAVTDQFTHPFEPLTQYPNTCVLGTYHPAFLLRDPRQDKVVMQHLLMAREWLSLGDIKYEEMPEPEHAPVCTVQTFTPGGEIALDCETYGCELNARDQTVFHPVKMRCIDHMQKHNIMLIQQIAWRDPQGKLHCGWFLDANTVHRQRLWKWLRKAGVLTGQNFKYDIEVIRYCHGENTIPTWRPVRDAMNYTYLLDDTLPRALKSVTPIFRVTSYGDEERPVKIFRSGAHASRYGCMDAWATYRIREITHERMTNIFAHHPNARWKTSKRTERWYSDTIWSAVLMEESGAYFDTDRLLAADEEARDVLAACIREGRQECGYTLSGEGSQASLQQLFIDAQREIQHHLDSILPDDRNAQSSAELAAEEDLNRLLKIERTETGLAKTDVDTRNLLLGMAPATTRASRALSLLAEVSGAKKITSTYTGPRLYGKETGKGTSILYRKKLVTTGKKVKHIKVVRHKAGRIWDHRLRLIRVYDKKSNYTGVAVSYPSWFFLPKADEKGKKGGVRQYRWSAKDHGLQTDPKSIKACMTSRYHRGIIGAWDYGQMEWRMAGFISNDQVMLDEIAQGVDPHLRTASILLDVDLLQPTEVRRWLYAGAVLTLTRCPNYKMRLEARRFARCKPSDYPPEFIIRVIAFCRQEAGKSENFAYLYGGTAPVILATVRTKSGFEIPLDRCSTLISSNNKRYRMLSRMRESDINEAIQFAAIHLPILGLSRTFSESERDIRGQYRGQVYDFPIQAISGLVLQSAIMETQKYQTQRDSPPFHVIINNHDAMNLDVPWRHARRVMQYAGERMVDNWYLRKLEEHYGRKFPVKVEAEVIAVRGLHRANADKLVKELNNAA